MTRDTCIHIVSTIRCTFNGNAGGRMPPPPPPPPPPPTTRYATTELPCQESYHKILLRIRNVAGWNVGSKTRYHKWRRYNFPHSLQYIRPTAIYATHRLLSTFFAFNWPAILSFEGIKPNILIMPFSKPQNILNKKFWEKLTSPNLAPVPAS